MNRKSASPLSTQPAQRPTAAVDDTAWMASVQQSLGRVAQRAQADAAVALETHHAAPAGRGGVRGAAIALGLLALVALAVAASRATGWWAPASETAAQAGAVVPARSAVTALAQPVPPGAVHAPAAVSPNVRMAVVADPADAGEQRLWAHLSAALDGHGGLALAPLPARGWSDALERLAVDQPRVAALRYDALRLARRGAPVPLAVVAPLFPHEVQVVVRADSPLRHLHELRGLRINAGPGPGARRLSARTLYEAMFDEPLPPAEAAALDEAPALAALLRGELDAVVLVASQPAPALADLPSGQAAALRLLALDADHPASRRARESVFLPARLRPERFAHGLLEGPQPTLALMSFLVASGQRGPLADAALGRFAAALCRQRPLLARMDAAWLALDPRLRLPTGWPTAAPAEAALRDCADAAGVTAAAPPSPLSSPAPALAAAVPSGAAPR